MCKIYTDFTLLLSHFQFTGWSLYTRSFFKWGHTQCRNSHYKKPLLSLLKGQLLWVHGDFSNWNVMLCLKNNHSSDQNFVKLINLFSFVWRNFVYWFNCTSKRDYTHFDKCIFTLNYNRPWPLRNILYNFTSPLLLILSSGAKIRMWCYSHISHIEGILKNFKIWIFVIYL